MHSMNWKQLPELFSFIICRQLFFGSFLECLQRHRNLFSPLSICMPHTTHTYILNISKRKNRGWSVSAWSEFGDDQSWRTKSKIIFSNPGLLSTHFCHHMSHNYLWIYDNYTIFVIFYKCILTKKQRRKWTRKGRTAVGVSNTEKRTCLSL